MYIGKSFHAANKAGAPDYVRVLPLGYVSSEKGDFNVDAESYELIKAHMKRHAVDIVVDYEHQTLRGVPAPAGGWIKDLVLKENGIFAAVEWTEKAKSYLCNGEYRYLSPVVMVRKEDKKAVQIHSVALTNTPAINEMTPIINSINPETIIADSLNETQKRICKMLNISEADYIKYS